MMVPPCFGEHASIAVTSAYVQIYATRLVILNTMLGHHGRRCPLSIRLGCNPSNGTTNAM